jgi:hypothetical protein
MFKRKGLEPALFIRSALAREREPLQAPVKLVQGSMFKVQGGERSLSLTLNLEP